MNYANIADKLKTKLDLNHCTHVPCYPSDVLKFMGSDKIQTPGNPQKELVSSLVTIKIPIENLNLLDTDSFSLDSLILVSHEIATDSKSRYSFKTYAIETKEP